MTTVLGHSVLPLAFAQPICAPPWTNHAYTMACLSQVLMPGLAMTLLAPTTMYNAQQGHRS